MKLVIDIPDKDYEFIKDVHILFGRRNGKQIEYNMINSIKNGTPYEERHKGEWIMNELHNTVCSICGGIRRDSRFDHIEFCNRCGADMRGEA